VGKKGGEKMFGQYYDRAEWLVGLLLVVALITAALV
jgi:hypothetical protein